MNKKGISPVIAISLMVIVSVISVVGFQGWFQSYGGNVYIDVQTQSKEDIGNSGIKDIIGDDVYFYNSGTINISITAVQIGTTVCPIVQDLEYGMNTIDLSTCSFDGGSNEIVIKTNEGFYTKKVYNAPSSY